MYFRRGEFTRMVIWRGRREDDGPAVVSAARQSHARLRHKVTREKGKKKKKRKKHLLRTLRSDKLHLKPETYDLKLLD